MQKRRPKKIQTQPCSHHHNQLRAKPNILLPSTEGNISLYLGNYLRAYLALNCFSIGCWFTSHFAVCYSQIISETESHTGRFSVCSISHSLHTWHLTIASEICQMRHSQSRGHPKIIAIQSHRVNLFLAINIVIYIDRKSTESIASR